MPKSKVIYYLNGSALSRVFSNLLNNAIKYSDGDLDITLSETGEIIFSNTASKLNEVQVGKLFDRFYTVEAARKSTGLGLAIARTLSTQIMGDIGNRIFKFHISLLKTMSVSAEFTKLYINLLLNKMLKTEILKMTIPEKPSSKKQKYFS